MKPVLLPALAAAALTLAACAHTSDEMSALSPSQMTASDIQAEIAALGAQAGGLYTSPLRVDGSPVVFLPVVVHHTDSNGVPFTTYRPDTTGYRASGSSSSRPFNYVRLQALERRRAELYAELSQRGLSLR